MENIGIDVSKATLSCAWRGSSRDFDNTSKGHQDLWDWAAGATACCLEATGRFHQAVAEAAVARGLRCLVVNPGRARKYLQFVNPRAKTDKLDAQALELLGEKEGAALRAYVVPPAAVAEARDLLVRRRALVEAKVKIRQVAREAGDPGGHLAGALEAMARAEKALDKELEKALSGFPGYENLLSVPGVGPKTAAAVTCAMERGEFLTADSLVAFFGLDPRPCDSGKHRGKRRLSHQGDAQARTFLFMAGRAGARLPAWKAYYQSQTSKGLSSTEATVVMARKLARVCWKVYRQDTPFRDTKTQEVDKPT